MKCQGADADLQIIQGEPWLYDALHLAFAQSASADVFLTTDDRLLRKAKQYPKVVIIPVENPVVWLMNQLQEEN